MSQPASLNGFRHGVGPDSRSDLGYGRLEPKFHKQRAETSSFPYRDSDDYSEEDIADIPIEIQNKLRKIIGSYLAVDFLSAKGTDPFYYAAGNSKIGENVTGKSLSPIPNLYKNRMQAGGGVNSPKAYSQGSLQRTGSTIGFSHPHKPLGPDKDIAYNDFEYFEDEEDLTLKRVRMVIKKMLESER